MKILLTGATGFIGRSLVTELLKENHEVNVLTRNVANAALLLSNRCHYFYWDTKVTIPETAFKGVDVVINLMGEGIADKKWSDDQKKLIYNSRIDGTRKLVEAIAQLKVKPKAFISTSAIGIYGDRGEETIKEDSKLGDDFLARLCKDWENEANKAQELGLRVAIIRVGIVVGNKGGVLKKMVPPFKFGVGGRIGSGRQYMSWIFVEDLARMFIWLANHKDARGIYNGTAPYPETNKQFSKVLASLLNRPALFPAPESLITKIFGEMSVILLGGQKVLPSKFQAEDFRFKSPSLEIALKQSL
jgi:uncharacterized protein (TIGR01777 family)